MSSFGLGNARSTGARTIAGVAAIAAALTIAAAEAAPAGVTPFPANDDSLRPAITASAAIGGFVAFLSKASNLVPGDTNGVSDAFVLHPDSGAIERVSLDANGGQLSDRTIFVNLSRDGRYVVYAYVGGLYRLDRQTGERTLVSVRSDGTPAPGDDFGMIASITEDGRLVAFESRHALDPADTDFNRYDIYLRDIVAGTTLLVTPQATSTFIREPVISHDGSAIVFSTTASLLPEDANTGCDVYRWFRATATLQLVTVTPSGMGSADPLTYCYNDLGPIYAFAEHDLTGNGLGVVFASYSTDLVVPPASGQGVYFRDLGAGQTTRIDFDDAGGPGSGGFWPRLTTFADLVTYLGLGQSPLGSQITFNQFQPPGPGRNARSGATGPSDLSDLGFVVSESLDLRSIGGPAQATFSQILLSRPLLGMFVTARLASAGRLGTSSDGQTSDVAISSDGRWVAFSSAASDLAAADLNGNRDVFVRDTQTGQFEIVSELQGPRVQGDGGSSNPFLSADGRFVVFQSRANNLSPGDSPFGSNDLYWKDRTTGVVKRITPGMVVSGIQETAAVSHDGLWVAFGCSCSGFGGGAGQFDVYLYNSQSGQVSLVSQAAVGGPSNGNSGLGGMSDDGRFIAYVSVASNLVAGDTNGFDDIFVHDRVVGTTVRASTTSTGEQANFGSSFPRISPDGQFVIFASGAANLTNGAGRGLVRKDLVTGATTSFTGRLLGPSNGPGFDSAGVPGEPIDVSADGRYVLGATAAAVQPQDSNGETDLYRLDFDSGELVWATRASARDIPNGRVRRDDFFQSSGQISADGRRVVFVSSSDNYVPDDDNYADDAFVSDLRTQSIQLASRVGGEPAQRDLVGPAIDAAGRRVVAESRDRSGVFAGIGGGAAKAGAGNAGSQSRIDLFNLATGDYAQVDVSQAGVPSNGNSGEPALAPNGSLVAFTSDASNLGGGGPPPGPKPNPSIYMKDPATGQMTLMTLPFNNQPPNGASTDSSIAISASGNSVVSFTSAASNLLAGDDNGVTDIYVAVAPAGGGAPQLEMVSADAAGEPANAPSVDADVSGDGQFVGWSSLASNLPTGGGGDFNSDWDVYLRDRSGGITICLTNGGNGPSGKPDIISFGGGPGGGGPGGGTGAGGATWFAVWESRANNLVGNDGNPHSDVFLKSNQGSGQTVLVSRAFNGGAANGPSYAPSISADARFVTFTSLASNLVQGDTNNAADIFVYDQSFGSITRVSQTPAAQANQFSMQATVVNVGGQPLVAWDTAATNISGEDDGAFDVAIRVGTAAPVQLEPPLFADGFE